MEYGTEKEATWIAFAHEVGHFLGAEHVEYGVMEYDASSDLTAHGKIQFWDDNHKQIGNCITQDRFLECLSN